MRKKNDKRIGPVALIVVLITMVIVGTSAVTAIATHSAVRSGHANASPSSNEKVNNLLYSYVYNATHNRSKWLYDLMNLSGLTRLDNSSDGKAIFRKAYELGVIGAYTEDDIYQPLNRLFVAQTMVKALGYPERTVGRLSDVTPDRQGAMGTMAYYGYFVPDEKDRVYPYASISAKEYEVLTKELSRYRAFKGKRLLSFGDSIMHGSGNHDEGIADLIAVKYGMTAADYSVPGASFADRGERSRICNQMRVANNANEKADLILLNGGTNDMGRTPLGEIAPGFDMANAPETDFSDSMQKALWMLDTFWKGVPTVYVRVHNMNLAEDTFERRYGDRALVITDKWDVKSVDLYNGTAMNTEIQSICDRYTFVDERYGSAHDSIHPNALGYAKYYLPLVSQAVTDQLSEV